MIIPWEQIDPETLTNLIKEFVLREGTDYGVIEIELSTKIQRVKEQLKTNDAVLIYSELHQSIDIKLKKEISQATLK